jgi:predicted dehydrogenase
LFSQVYSAIESGGSGDGAAAYPTFADGHDAMVVTEAVARSHDEGRWTKVAR